MASQAIGIDIGTHAVKVAVLQRKGATTRALRLFQATLAGDEDMVRVQGALARAGIKGGPGLLGITGRDLIIRYTHVPPVPDWRLKLLMQFEINEVSGQSGGEVASDYRRIHLPTESDEDTVLVALTRDTWLKPRLTAANSSGMSVAGGCPNSVALFNAFLAHGELHDGETTYLVNLGRDNIDMAIQRDGELLFARNMAGGGHMFTESIMGTFGLREPKAEKNKVTKGDLTPKGQARYPDSTSEKIANAMQGPAGQLVSMVQSTVMICRAQTRIPDLAVDRLLLTGGAAKMKGIREYFAANMNTPVEIFDPVGELDLSGLDPADADELDQTPYEFATAVGLAETLLNSNSMRLEVLTEKERKKRNFGQRTIWALAAAAAALVWIVLLFQDESSKTSKVLAANEEIDLQLEKIKLAENRQKAAIEKESDARHKEVALRVRRLPGLLLRKVLLTLGENEPEGMFLESVQLENAKVNLDLAGNPTNLEGGRGEDKGDRVHQQVVWPEVVVQAVVQKELITRRLGDAVNDYQSKVRMAASKLDVDGFKVECETESLRGTRFKMTFRLKVEPADSES
ncbi:MAG: pilus assembly protein PilM [Planctomycetota bacterium]|jgi:type IV pilus assembly protein PilM